MFLITFGEDTILHTGDYKYNEDMVKTICEKHMSWDNHNHRFRVREKRQYFPSRMLRQVLTSMPSALLPQIYIDPTFWHPSWSHPDLKKHNYLDETVKIIRRELEKNPQRKVCRKNWPKSLPGHALSPYRDA
jgi:hypothetical protein